MILVLFTPVKILAAGSFGHISDSEIEKWIEFRIDLDVSFLVILDAASYRRIFLRFSLNMNSRQM